MNSLITNNIYVAMLVNGINRKGSKVLKRIERENMDKLINKLMMRNTSYLVTAISSLILHKRLWSNFVLLICMIKTYHYNATELIKK